MADLKDWMQRRMTPAQANSERWTDLAQAIEEFWGLYAEPHVDAAERALSVFTADDEDIDRKLAELGTKFEVALPITPSSKAMAYSMRAYEIHRKDRQDTLEIILQRDFAGAAIKWLPLMAPKDLPYGTLFLSDHDLNWSDYTRDQLWQTSRGRVVVDLSASLYYGFTRESIESAINRKLAALRPAHIVFDGTMFFSFHVIPVEPTKLWQGIRTTISQFEPIDADPFLPFRFDDYRLDDHPLDWFTPLRIGRREIETKSTPVKVPFKFNWRLDMGWEIDGRYNAVPGIESDRVEPLHYLQAHSVKSERITLLPTAFSAGKVESWQTHIVKTNPFRVYRFDEIPLDDEAVDRNALSARGCTVSVPAGFKSSLPPIGDMPALDDVPLDFTPLDLRFQ